MSTEALAPNPGPVQAAPADDIDWNGCDTERLINVVFQASDGRLYRAAFCRCMTVQLGARVITNFKHAGCVLSSAWRAEECHPKTAWRGQKPRSDPHAFGVAWKVRSVQRSCQGRPTVH